MLDKEWSFAVGLPRSLHDGDVDPELPDPVSPPRLENITCIRDEIIVSDIQIFRP